MTSWKRGLVVVAGALSGAWIVAARAADDARLPVPDPAARAPAAAALKKEFKDELKAKDAEARTRLVRTLIDRVADAKRDPVERFVSGEQAEATAEELHDVRLAFDAVRRLGATFQIQTAARAWTSIDAATRGAKEPSILVEGASAYVDLAGESLVEDDSSTAGKALASAKTLASSAKLPGLAARAMELVDLVAAFRKELAAAGVAEAALEIDAQDPGAHDALGRYLAFGHGDFVAGLPHLAKGPDGALKDVAVQDAAKPSSPAELDAVADAWWQAAQKEKDPLARARMLARAAHRYEATPDDASAERKALAKSRLDSVTWSAWGRSVALTKDFAKAGPAALAPTMIRACIDQKKIERDGSAWRTKVPKFPDVKFAGDVEYLWTLDTNLGVVVLRLLPDVAPNHVANCIYLSELGFYDGLIFHRVIPGFMAQGGAIQADGNGGPAYKFDGEFGSSRKFDRAGLLAMANAGPGTDESQFFITFAAADHLTGKHTIFGEVVSGMDVVKKMEELGTPEGKTKSEIVIRTARVSVR